MQETFLKAEEFTEHLKEYVSNRVAALKLQTAEKTSVILANFIAIAVVAAIAFIFIIFISMAAAYALSDMIGKNYAGFLIVGVTWLFIAVIGWISREKILRIPIMNKMLHQMFSDEKDSKPG